MSANLDIAMAAWNMEHVPYSASSTDNAPRVGCVRCESPDPESPNYKINPSDYPTPEEKSGVAVWQILIPCVIKEHWDSLSERERNCVLLCVNGAIKALSVCTAVYSGEVEE